MTRKPNVLFYNKKGGQGKTTHAVAYASHVGAVLYTNDEDNDTLDIYGDLFKDGDIRVLKPGEEIEVDDEETMVFDMGGYLDNRIIQIAEFVDVCVVPIKYQSKADFSPSIRTIMTLTSHNKNVVVLINNTSKEEAEEVKKLLEENFDHKVFVINSSKYINRLADEQKTVFDLLDASGLNRYMLKKNVVPQITSFYNYLDQLLTEEGK